MQLFSNTVFHFVLDSRRMTGLEIPCFCDSTGEYRDIFKEKYEVKV